MIIIIKEISKNIGNKSTELELIAGSDADNGECQYFIWYPTIWKSIGTASIAVFRIAYTSKIYF